MALTEIPIELSSTPSIVDGGNATAITIDSSENVGIGTSSLTGGNTILNLSRTGSGVGCNMQFANTHNGAFYVGLAGNTSGDAILHSADGTAGMAFGTGNTERVRIDSSGNFIVGATSAPAGWGGTGPMIFLKPSTNTNGLVVLSGSSNNGLRFLHDGTTAVIDSTYGTGGSASAASITFKVAGSAKGEFASNGRLYLYAQASGAGNADLRYSTSTGLVTYDTSSRLVKAEIEDIPYGLRTVMALSPKRYQRTDSDNKLEVGFIADEVVEVVPELVGMMEKRFLTMNQEDTEVVAGSVEYNKMTAVLVKAIQELKEELNTATARITELENN